MGILAPLSPRLKNRDDGHSRLHLSTGAGSFMPALLFLFFGLVAFGMHLASSPLLQKVAALDPSLGAFVSIFLKSAGSLGLLGGFVLLGYRQFITCSSQDKMLVAGQRVWGIPLQNVKVPYSKITHWFVENRVPKRYRPELNPQNKPVGYWQLAIEWDPGKRSVLDRAPKEEEMRWLERCLREYIEKTSS